MTCWNGSCRVHFAPAPSSPRCTPRTSVRRRLSLDDGRIEQVTSGRDRGAGIRVVKGDTTGFAHTADLSEAGLAEAAAAAAAAASQGGGGARTVALGPAGRHAVNTIGQFPDDVPKATKVDLLRRVDEAARVGRSGDRPGVGRLRRQPQADPRRQHRRRAGRRRSRCRVLMRISAVANGDTGMQTGFQSDGPHDRVRDVRLGRRRRARPRRGPPGDHEAGRPAGAQRRAAGRHQAGQRRGAVPRGVRARPRGRPRRQGRERVPRQGRASWSRRRSSRSSTTAR